MSKVSKVQYFLVWLELVLATVCVVFDLLIPTLLILMLALVSLRVRKEHFSQFGFVRPQSWPVLVGAVTGLTILWTLLHLSLTIPLLMKLTGERQDLGGFLALQGNVGLLLFMLLASWTLAALAEEIVFRGYLQRRIRQAFPGMQLAPLIAILGSSVLFALIHTEQGKIGIALTFLDALFFSTLKYLFKNTLWAAILAHGLSNTIGLLFFFFFGPIYSFWEF